MMEEKWGVPVTFYRKRLFPLLAGLLWLAFLTLDLTGWGDSTWVKFAAICLCCATAFTGMKTTDGKFLKLCQEIGKEYPEIITDDWYIDITTAKLIDEKRRGDFKVFILPNLYGDIITDEAAEFQGGVGTAGSANLGKQYAMFEAIHGSAPRMVAEGRDIYADPCSMLRAAVLLLSHIGYQPQADKLDRALDICMYEEKKLTVTGRNTGCTCREFGEYVMETMKSL